jgi:gamma-glutamylcyclotransferase (GGCT)/AIG2-like uncharacterized protein YtfP
MAKHFVFVYGTLKTGFHNHYLLSSAKFIGKAVTKERGTLLEKGIPFFNDEKKTSLIHGEIFEVNENTLSRLDMLEGYDSDYPNRSWYQRKIKEFDLLDDNNQFLDVISAYVYVNNDESGKINKTGIYGHS